MMIFSKQVRIKAKILTFLNQSALIQKSVDLDKVLFHRIHKSVGVWRWWNYCRIFPRLQLLVNILDLFYRVVRPHVVNNSHPKFLPTLNYQEGVVDDFMSFQKSWIFL